ncbi:ATP-binding protein [Sphingomonas sp. KR3-1]|uniref:hybrid sensor histidine kinase/response regulator n=1 Tax=Sphingomonas sp. KR3-1 TaxID=3156611 RepID=UPI0032B459EB
MAAANRSTLSLETFGDLGRLTAAIGVDSPLGPVSSWSGALTAAVRMLLPSRAEIVMFWGPEYCALYNDAYAPTIGDKHPRALGQSARIWWGELWDDLGPLLEGVRETGETYWAKDRPFYIERDGGRGETVYFDISYSPVFDDDGSVGGVLCIVSETTARVLAEREAIADRNRLWTLARDPFLIADAKGIWRNVSPAWTEILGWSEEELIGRTSQWMEHPDDVQRTREEIDDLAHGELTLRFENRFRGKDGKYRWFSWTAVPEGELLYCVARDITAEREAAASLEAAEEALRQSQKMETVGQLTGGVAHDFNNLLQIVTGNLDILQRNLPDDSPRLVRAAGAAMNGAQRAAVLTQRLLAFSRRQPLAPERIDPNRLIASMSDLLHRSLGETIEMEIVQAGRLWPVEVDANQLENALLNLAVNARDAMPGGGKLTIETANTHLDANYTARDAEMTPGQYVLISVSDTGSGMDAETLNRAFEPFFTTKEVGRGTGLGLSMVYGFIKQSGGHIRIYSEPGQGTTVKIYLPRYFGEAPEAPAPAPVEHAPAAANAETILVCEDDENVRAYTVDVLRELGYRVIEAGDGPAALAALDAEPGRIDLLFTDVVLPRGMTGAVLAAEAQRRRPALKVLFTTGYARNAIVHHGRLDPGVQLLPKPFTYGDLAAKVRDMLDG